jgi:hypothetical protein
MKTVPAAILVRLMGCISTHGPWIMSSQPRTDKLATRARPY